MLSAVRFNYAQTERKMKKTPFSGWPFGAAVLHGSLATAVAEPISSHILGSNEFDIGRIAVTAGSAIAVYFFFALPLMQLMPKKAVGTLWAWASIAIVAGIAISMLYLAASLVGLFHDPSPSTIIKVIFVTTATGAIMTWIMCQIT